MNSIIRQLRILLGLGCLLAGTFPTADATPGPGDFVDVIGVRVTDVKGRQHRIGVSTGKVGAAALVFLDTACPVATRYIPALNALHDDAQARGVSLYGVLSNPDIGWRESVDFVDDFGIEFPVIVDSAGDLAVRLGPRVTSESFLISTANRIVYRGRIDDRFAAAGRLRTRITSHGLRDAIENVARGGRPEPYETEAVGCFHYAWGELGEPGAGTGEVTWARHVAPLLRANCVECHREGGIAPFSLEGYENAKRWHRMIAWMTGERLMPPWRAVPWVLDRGQGMWLPKGGDLVLEVHYHLNGKATTDRSEVAFYFAREPVYRYVDGVVIGTEDLRIPPGEESYWRRFSMDVPAGMSLTDVTPHMHFLGREVHLGRDPARRSRASAHPYRGLGLPMAEHLHLPRAGPSAGRQPDRRLGPIRQLREQSAEPGRSAPDRHLGLGDHRRDERAVDWLHSGFAER